MQQWPLQYSIISVLTGVHLPYQYAIVSAKKFKRMTIARVGQLTTRGRLLDSCLNSGLVWDRSVTRAVERSPAAVEILKTVVRGTAIYSTDMIVVRAVDVPQCHHRTKFRLLSRCSAQSHSKVRRAPGLGDVLLLLLLLRSLHGAPGRRAKNYLPRNLVQSVRAAGGIRSKILQT